MVLPSNQLSADGLLPILRHQDRHDVAGLKACVTPRDERAPTPTDRGNETSGRQVQFLNRLADRLMPRSHSDLH